MPGAPKPITGRCLCGSVTYSADAEPLAQAVCHCTDRQRQTGNPFPVIVAVPRAAPELAFIKAGSLDDASWIEPAVEVWTRSAQPWSPHFEHAPRMEREPQ